MIGRRLAALLAVLLLVGCQRFGADPVHGDRLVVGEAADPKNLNPYLASAAPVAELSPLLYSTGVTYDQHGRPFPDTVVRVPTIANGDVSRDGLTLRYRLRRNARWSDGVPLTCRDLRFTWHAVMNPANNVTATDGWSSIRDIDCSDPHVAVVHMKRVYASFLATLWSNAAPILPEHVLAKYNDAKGDFNSAPYNSAPSVSSGPYIFVSWTRGSSVVMRANPYYFRGKPPIAEIEYRIIPDQNTLQTEVQTGELDLGWNLLPQSNAILARWPGLRTITPITYVYDHIDFNLLHPIFQDVRLRRALTYAIDRAAMLRTVRYGLGELSPTLYPRALYPALYDPTAPTYPYDPAKARALLDQAGWHVGPGGVRRKGKERLAFTISTQNESQQGQSLETQLQAYWRAVGAAVTVKNYPTALFFDNDPHTGILQGQKYDVALYAWANSPDPDLAPLYAAWNLPPHGQNTIDWIDPRATVLFRDETTSVDPARRDRDFRAIARLFAQDDPSIILWYRRDVIGYVDELENFTATPAQSEPFWDPWAWRLRRG